MTELTDIVLRPIGVVRNGRTDLDDDRWGRVASVIKLDATRFTADALAGLEAFSHVEVVFHFHRLAESDVSTGARHPRGNPDSPLTGIFAQRGSPRPNRIGVTRCRVVSLEGPYLVVEGLDAVDGTPVLDIKPWFAEFGPQGSVRQPEWTAEVMAEYWSPRTEGI